MIIGLDFDNTIVGYDLLFHKVALEQGLIAADVPCSKVGVRDYLRGVDREDVWTEMQGHVYGERMAEAEIFPGVVEFLRRCRSVGVAVAIVSHKTRHPFIGPRHDLHAAARGWVDRVLQEDGPLVDPRRVYFELTKSSKIERIARIGCDYFIDDLPEILRAPAFPSQTRGVLFDPQANHTGESDIDAFDSWHSIREYMERRWTPAL